jgi:beta-glucosidase
MDSKPATCFPTASALAATWNRDLVSRVGEALGDECRAEQVGVILGPGANIKRSPLCGRNFEYFSEDPYLSGEMAKSHINGVQSRGVGASLKHYAANNQETRRMVINAVVDERALHEIYLAGFEIAVKEAQPWTVMCAYNKVNGTYCCENEILMRHILKEKWGHEGLVVTDWGAMNDRVAALAAGVELEMPGPGTSNDARIVTAVKSGELNEALLDQAVERILALIFKAGETLAQAVTCDLDAHHALARRVAGEGAVLLKNEAGAGPGKILPLADDCKVALVGRFAREPRYQGAGSSLIHPTRLDNLYDEIVKLVGEENLSYAPGYDAGGHEPDAALIAQALERAKTAEVVVVCAGLTDIYEVEGLDRRHMKLPPGHDALIKAIAAAHDNVVVVLSNGSPVEMPWVEDVAAILEGYLGGQAGAGALADILYGRVNPSGKLAETFPIRLQDNPSYHYFPQGPDVAEYRESIFVGYRYYDTVGQEVLFPFGHGLSYTNFAYSDLQLDRQKIKDGDTLAVTLKVQNTGQVAGQEVVQLYVRDEEAAVFRPHKELKGFAKVALEPGETAKVSIELGRRAFAYYEPQLGDWVVKPGTFEILIAASAADIRLRARVAVTDAPVAPGANGHTAAVYHDLPRGEAISRQDFEALLGHPVPANGGFSKGRYTVNTPVGDMRDSFLGRRLYGYVEKRLAKMTAGKEDTPTGLLMRAVVREMPLRAMLVMGNGAVSREIMEAFVAIMNGKILRGSGALIKAIFDEL